MRGEQSSAGEVIDLVAGHLLRSKCASSLEQVLLCTQDARKYVLRVSLVELAHTCPRLVEETVKSPRILLRHYERAALVAQHYMKAKHAKQHDMTVKSDVRVRIFGIPGTHTHTGRGVYRRLSGLESAVSTVSPKISEIRSSLAGRLVCVSGTIVKCGSPRLVEYKQQFQCGRCKHRFTVDIDIDAGGYVQLPEICPNRKRRGRNSRGSSASSGSQENESKCQGTNFHRCEDVGKIWPWSGKVRFG